MALMELERSWRESTRVPSRSKISNLTCSDGIGRLVLIISPSFYSWIYLPQKCCRIYNKESLILTRIHGNQDRTQADSQGAGSARESSQRRENISGTHQEAAHRFLPADVPLTPAR